MLEGGKLTGKHTLYTLSQSLVIHMALRGMFAEWAVDETAVCGRERVHRGGSEGEADSGCTVDVAWLLEYRQSQLSSEPGISGNTSS